ncbi:MAG: MFS transporter [Marinibacterium sp.]
MNQGGYLRRNARWLGAGALVNFLSSFGQTFFISIFAGEIRTTFDLSLGQWGGIYTLGTGLAALAMLWTGALTDRFRVRALGPFVLAGLAAACLAMAFNVGAGLLVAIVFALRLFGQGMATHLAIVAMARWFDATRGQALSISALGFWFGQAVLPLGFVALMPLTGWRPLWGLAALIVLLAIWPLSRLLKAERTPQAHALDNPSAGMDGHHWTRGAVLASPVFWMMIPTVFAPSAFNTAFFFHQVHLAEIKGWSHLHLVQFFPLFTVVSVASMMVSGRGLDRVGAVRLMALTQVPILFAFAVLGGSSGTGGMVLGLSLLGLNAGMMATIPNAFWAEAFGTAHIGAIKAAVTAAMVLGSAAGPGITGWLIDLGFALDRQFLAMAAVFAMTTELAAVAAAQVQRRIPSSLSAPA